MFFLLIFFTTIVVYAGADTNMTACDGRDTNFDISAVIGTWYVVAIIPEKLFPDTQKQETCYKMDLSETDEAGLRWLVRKKVDAPQTETMQSIQGTIVRQRYHSERPFDVWSKSINEVKGCFQQVLTLDTDRTNIGKAISQNATMQLHLVHTNDKKGAFLVQVLWGRMISAVIYRRTGGVTQDQLKPVYEFMMKRRGAQRTPRICVQSKKQL